MVSINDRLVELSRWMGDALQTVEGIIAAAITEVSNAVQPYPDRAEWVAKSIPATVVRTAFIVHGQTFPVIRDADGAFSQADGTKWSPDGPAMFGHWNITGVLADGPGSTNWYTAIPTVDETARIQQAMNYCLARGISLSGEANRVYGITDQLVWGRNGTTVPSDTGQTLLTARFVVIGGVWPAGDQSSADEQDFTFGKAALVVGNGMLASIDGSPNSHRGKYATPTNVYVDCNRLARVGVWYRAMKNSHGQYSVLRATEADVRVGQDNDNEWNGNGSLYSGRGAQFCYSEQSDGVLAFPGDGTGYWGPTGRTSYGFVMDGSDCNVFGAEHNSGKVACLYKSGINVNFDLCYFWNGNSRTDVSSATLLVAKDKLASNGTITMRHGKFSNCRFDDGGIVLKSFHLSFLGCSQIQFNGTPSSVRLIASRIGETARDLIFRNCGITEDGVLETVGAGTWGTFLGNVGGNRRGDGRAASVGGLLESFGLAAKVSNTAMQVDVPLTGLAVQSSTTDATPGRLQLVGAFGSGATELPNAADPNAITVSGKYRVFGLTNTPTAGIFVLEHFQRFSGQATQTAYMLGSPQRLYKRDFFNSAWSTWRLFNETLGAVSQTGGSPTGAIIERGSNANGDFVRFADGTQIAISPEFTADVTSATGSIFRMSAAQGWTLPSAFVGPTSGSVSTIGSSSTHFGSLNIIGALSAEIMLFAPSSTTGRRFRAVVNGRWF